MATKNYVRMAALAAVLGFARPSVAQEGSACARVSRVNVAACALRASPAVDAERAGAEALRGRQSAARAWLPSNPVATLSASRRTAAGGSLETFNWHASLAQEVELGGQRGARQGAADAQLAAQQQRIVVARREVAAEAWALYFEVLASEEEVELVARMSTAVEGIVTAARARAAQGLTSLVEATVAETSTLRVVQAKASAERRLAGARAALAALLGLDPASPIVVEGELIPLPGVEEAARRAGASVAEARPEMQAAEAERASLAKRADLYRRLRIPSPSVSVFVQNDGFNEHVLGVGLSFPVPLPGPVGRSYAGEIAEADALAQRASAEKSLLQRRLRLELVTALDAYSSRRREVEAIPPARVQGAEDALRALSLELQAGRLGVRDALVSEQALLEVLQAHLAARKALALASVDLARAAGLALEGGPS